MHKKKKNSKQVRVSLKMYEEIRRLAYKAHLPMTVVLEQIISNAKLHESLGK